MRTHIKTAFKKKAPEEFKEHPVAKSQSVIASLKMSVTNFADEYLTKPVLDDESEIVFDHDKFYEALLHCYCEFPFFRDEVKLQLVLKEFDLKSNIHVFADTAAVLCKHLHD